MSTRWAYTNRYPVGNITTIYCSRPPTDEEPAGCWIISRRGGDSINLKDASENSFYYYEDKNAYRAAVTNASEVARRYMKKRQEECCVVM